MKVAIVEVFAALPDRVPLLAHHLDALARHTDVEYRVFGTPVRLPDAAHELLDRPEVELCDVGAIDATGSAEHSFYLERLTEHALHAGAELVATMHVDAFPVRPGWLGDLLPRLTPDRPLAAVRRDEHDDHKPHPCFMVFRADFYREHRPPFYVDDPDTLLADSYRAFAADVPHTSDSGNGFGWTLHRHGLDWLPLPPTAAADPNGLIGVIYDDRVFHLAGGTRPSLVMARDRRQAYERVGGGAADVDHVRFHAEAHATLSRWDRLRVRHATRRARRRNATTTDSILRELFDDPDGFVSGLRRG